MVVVAMTSLGDGKRGKLFWRAGLAAGVVQLPQLHASGQMELLFLCVTVERMRKIIDFGYLTVR